MTSSPTILEKIRHRAIVDAYQNARRLGFQPVDAYREGAEVAAFVNMIAEPARGPQWAAYERMRVVKNPAALR